MKNKKLEVEFEMIPEIEKHEKKLESFEQLEEEIHEELLKGRLME